MRDFINEEALNTLNHSCAHVMAQAVKHLYPQAKFWVGPVVSEGFYYDMDLGDVTLKEEDLERVETEITLLLASIQDCVREKVKERVKETGEDLER